jgi:hypothetical protein
MTESSRGSQRVAETPGAVIKRPQRILKGCQMLAGAENSDSDARTKGSQLNAQVPC